MAERRIFGHMPDGTAVEELTLHAGALEAKIITYGGALRALTVPGKTGRTDVVLGFDRLEDYRIQTAYLGALVGRYANRIGGSRFTLNGEEYRLPANEGPNQLHGGPNGFSKQVWTVADCGDSHVTLSLVSPDGQEGYPGQMAVEVTYSLNESGLEIRYRAKSTRDTVCNLTNHAYFNLSGHASGPVTGQYIQLLSGHYTPTDASSIPTGEIAGVEGTPMDLREMQPIGARIDDPFPQLVQAGGYDHNWVIDGWDGSARLAARAWSPDTGILLEALTTLPGVQFYSGNFLGGCPAGKGGAPYANRWGFCLETQFFPDSPNHPGFPSALLPAGEEFRQKTVYRFFQTDRPD